MLDQDNVIDVSVEPRKIPPMQGWQWIVNAFMLFKQAPTAWLGISGVFIVLMLGMSMLPFVGSLLSTLLGPVFLGGVMFAAQKQARGETPQLSDLFAGFQLRFAELLRVGVLYLFGTMLVMVLMAALLAGAAFVGLISLDKNLQAFEQMSAIWPVMILVVLAFSVVYSTYFYAPTLVMLQGMKASEAMKLSFLAFWRNWQPILVMSVIGAVGLILAMLPMFLGLLVALPVALITSYVCYVDVFEA
ncbi:BPSS1780 family membrane protein [Deefgea rivuli]|jgi:uncharacterized membrane protein|uniref:BPSS1780 family membrane protein n=1 Tax=Deefgea rivuli TaxID=400948 RepID=UPI0004891B2D|nr:BPSS1780 family membrane protein [Deefgea rivuli]